MSEQNSRDAVSRRQMLAGSATVAALGLAGCSSAMPASPTLETTSPEPQPTGFSLGDPELEEMESRVGVSFWVTNAEFGGDTAYVKATLYDGQGGEVATGYTSIGLSGGDSAPAGIYWDINPGTVYSFDIWLITEEEYEQR